jgi:hypothetical protein
MDITEYLIATADECALIAKTGRMLVERLDAVTGTRKTAPLSPFSRLSDGGLALSERVERIAQSLLAKAAEIDRERQKNNQRRT